MISEESVAAATTAARDALEQKRFEWIRWSALTERAYFLGLYNGLEAIAPENSLQSLLIQMLAETMSLRDVDDPFRLSKIGRGYRALINSLHEMSRGLDIHSAGGQNLMELQAQIHELRNLLADVGARRAESTRHVEGMLSMLEVLIGRSRDTSINPAVRQAVEECHRMEEAFRLLHLAVKRPFEAAED